MHAMWCDETNRNKNDRVLFFIYGGLCLDVARVADLHHAIAKIRASAGLTPRDKLKFQTSSRPKHIEQEIWNEAKGKVIAACLDVGASFLAVVIHHEIAASNSDKLIDWQLNTLLTKYDQNYLGFMHGDTGMVFIDRIENGREYALMRQKFTEGGAGTSPRMFQNVVSYAGTCDGASHLSSAADIVLGTFGFIVNQRGDIPITRKLAQDVWPLIWRPEGGSVWGDGIMMVPWNVRASRYAEAYAELRTHLINLTPR